MHNINSVLQDFFHVLFSYLLLLFMNWKTQYCYVSSTKNCFNEIPIKIPRNKLNQGCIKLIYSEKFQTLMKEVEAGTNKWKHIMLFKWKN